MDTDIYRQIAKRTGGDIYIGVVGAVRTGKSTFIRRFMELLVLPSVTDEYDRSRIQDELPQSGSGKSVMTTQPSFVPADAVEIPLADAGAKANIRMVDCVGYMIDGAMGQSEGDMPRMVHTPWQDEEMPFSEAAKVGTEKVIGEHSTVGVLVTTDGSIAEIPRSSYVAAEEMVAEKLKSANKPFVIVLNSKTPQNEETQALRGALEEKYGVKCILLDILNMESVDCMSILENLLYEFPISTINVEIPAWVRTLGEGSDIVKRLFNVISSATRDMKNMKDRQKLCDAMEKTEDFMPPELKKTDFGTGCVTYTLEPVEGLFYKVLSLQCGFEIKSDCELIEILKDFAVAKAAYDRLSGALEEAERTGYGLVPPAMEDMTLETPEIVKQGTRYGVRLKASASGMHLIKINVDSEIAPLVGSQEQSAELVDYLMDTIRNTPDMIWQTNIFGKSLYDIVSGGMMGKVNSLPDDVRMKLRDAVQRIVNENCNNLICVML